jgi:hypothetical protein
VTRNIFPDTELANTRFPSNPTNEKKCLIPSTITVSVDVAMQVYRPPNLIIMKYETLRMWVE